jgi:hypothetical protein
MTMFVQIHPHSFTFIQIISMCACALNHICHVDSSKLHPFIHLHPHPHPPTTIFYVHPNFIHIHFIYIHPHASIFSSMFIHIYHPNYIHLSIYVLSFMSIQITSIYPSIFIKISFHWCNQWYNWSILSYMSSCTRIHIYHLWSSKLHPYIQHCSSTSIIYIHPNVIQVLIYFHPCTQWSIQNHLHSSKFESTYIHVSTCVHPHLSRYSTSLVHPHYIHVSIT